ncbi:PepSY-associated TM helix domain-containing protein [Rhizorhapis suberifaciens]|uniref:Putative iron-regulated membrane protein n=1 Tax=Rhizorhapis suberifaciens TaxID=13656 RepID=A0A840HZD0_9SPHN|nr:PepSY-associated TM helix domain-containing protein [Rhizorhapis suberifaciens]MBB4642868.1 putative iron-regulated membrane protein [Rhizorhapis suberifaciens]
MKLLDLLHRWIGGLIGLVLAVLGISGALLVHKDAWVVLPHASDPQVQDTAAIARTVETVMADPARRPDMITFASQNFGLDRLGFADGSGAYITQQGELITRWASQWERPELWLFDLHHHLFAGDLGETIAGIAAIAGLFFVISGVILWTRTRKTFEFRVLPRRISRPAILRHHRDLGVVAAPLLLLALLTGAILVFRPMAALILGPSAPLRIDASLKAPKSPPLPLSASLEWRAMIEAARRRFPDAEIRSLSLPRQNSGLITLRMKKSEEWLPNGRTTLWFAPNSGRLVGARDASRLPDVVKGYNMLYPLHAAKVGGLAYRLMMTFAGLTLGLLGTLTLWSFWFSARKTNSHDRAHRAKLNVISQQRLRP